MFNIKSWFHKKPKEIPLDILHAKMQARLFDRAFEILPNGDIDDIMEIFSESMEKYLKLRKQINETQRTNK
jgi:hypothetical protein